LTAPTRMALLTAQAPSRFALPMSQAPEKRPFSQPAPDSGRPLPHSIDAERYVLGALLLDPNWIVEVMQVVRPDDFYLHAHQEIFRAMVDLQDRGQPIEIVLLGDELKRRGRLEEAGGYVTLAALEQSTVSPGAAPEMAQRVADKAVLRSLMRAADAIQRDCVDEQGEVSDLVDRAEKLIFDISQKNNLKSFVHIGEIMGDAIEEIGRLRANQSETTGIPTGYYELDALLNGLQPKNLMILAARPSIGKTAFALNVMMNIAVRDHTPVAIFSLEMGADQLNRRLLTCHSRIPGHLIATGRIKEKDFTELRVRAAELAECPIFIDDTPGLSIMQLRARARRLKAQQPSLGLIVVDYLQLMRGTDRGGRDFNRQQEVSEISRGLKELANELNVPLLALSQLSRNIEQRSGKDKSATPMLSDLRESGSIEQDADIVMFVHRERVEVAKDAEGKPVDRNAPIPTDIIVGKHRNGPIGKAELLFFADFTRFSNRSAEP